MEKEVLRARILERLEATGKSAHAVSKEIGANAGYVRDLLDPAKGGFPKSDKMNALAKALHTTSDYLSGIVDVPDAVISEASLREMPAGFRAPAAVGPPIPLIGTGDCADIDLTDENGQLVSIGRTTFDADHHVRLIKRPPALVGARDLYAIYFEGESMIPRFEPGEVGIVDPSRPVRAGDYVLVQLNSGESDDVTTVLVKRLINLNAERALLEQFNPAIRFTVPRRMISRIHRILPQLDLLFG